MNSVLGPLRTTSGRSATTCFPFFAKHRLTEISIAEIDRYKTAKLKEGKLGASQINKTLKRLAQVLQVAVRTN